MKDLAAPLLAEDQSKSGKKWLSVAGLVGGIASMSCCILPLILFSLGAGGALTGTLTALSPYQPYIMAVTLVLVASGFYLVYRKPQAAACAPDSFCANPNSNRITKGALWMSALFVAMSFAFNLLAPIFLDAS
ncbi:MAG: mercuric transporter MerT family protein [Rhodospirillales bacterium]|nr:mercuric transporter MerT family protein [Rhodospirillales bacterium]